MRTATRLCAACPRFLLAAPARRRVGVRVSTAVSTAVAAALLLSSCTSTPAADPTSTATPASATNASAAAAPDTAAQAAASASAAASRSAVQAAAQQAARQAKARAAAKSRAVAAAAAQQKAVVLAAQQKKQAALAAQQKKAALAKAARARAAARYAGAAARVDPLTGQYRSPNPVIAVKLDNTSKGRPQFGIDKADNVYVEQVEGGLTRIIGVFHTHLPSMVGPVRSVRSTDTQLLPAYGRPILVFSGGAGGPLQRLAEARITSGASLGFTRRTSARSAPYNLVADLASIANEQAARQGGKKFYVQSPGFHFRNADPTLGARPKVSDIDVRMTVGRTDFRWEGHAWRVLPAGSPGVAADGTALYAVNVLIQHVTDRPDGTVDTNGQPSLLSRTAGKGTFQLFRNGRMIEGTWSRAVPNAPTIFKDKQGRVANFATGKTWIMLVPQTGSASHS